MSRPDVEATQRKIGVCYLQLPDCCVRQSSHPTLENLPGRGQAWLPAKQKTLSLWAAHSYSCYRGGRTGRILSGAFSDTSALRLYHFDLPQQSGSSVTRLITITSSKISCAKQVWNSCPYAIKTPNRRCHRTWRISKSRSARSSKPRVV